LSRIEGSANGLTTTHSQISPNVVAGEQSTFHIFAHDAYGNKITKGGDKVGFFLGHSAILS